MQRHATLRHAMPRHAVTTHDLGTRYHEGIQGDSRTATGNFFILTLRLQRQRYWLAVWSLLANLLVNALALRFNLSQFGNVPVLQVVIF